MKMIFLICQRVWKTVKCQGEIRESQEILRWMIGGNPDDVQTAIRSASEFIETPHRSHICSCN